MKTVEKIVLGTVILVVAFIILTAAFARAEDKKPDLPKLTESQKLRLRTPQAQVLQILVQQNVLRDDYLKKHNDLEQQRLAKSAEFEKEYNAVFKELKLDPKDYSLDGDFNIVKNPEPVKEAKKP